MPHGVAPRVCSKLLSEFRILDKALNSCVQCNGILGWNNETVGRMRLVSSNNTSDLGAGVSGGNDRTAA